MGYEGENPRFPGFRKDAGNWLLCPALWSMKLAFGFGHECLLFLTSLDHVKLV